MKLSELLTYLRSINSIDLNGLRNSVEHQLNDAVYNVKKLRIDDFQPMIDSSGEIIKNFNKIDEFLSSYKDKIKHEVASNDLPYFRQSYKIYEEMSNDTPEYILSRTNTPTVDNTKELKNRINLYSSWKHAGLYIRPGYNDYIDQMIASDPLYIADQDQQLLEPVKTRWNNLYQKRVRYIIMKDSFDKIFHNIPENQIGLIVATNFFDFKPFEVLRHYLLEFLTLLKPGGVVLFTYNNCDMPHAVKNVEAHFNCYTPGRLVKDFVIGIGYELLYSGESDSGVNWIEIKKPGELSSIRGGQCIAEIKKNKDIDI